MDRLPKIGLPIIVAVILIVILISKSAITIGSGEAGVLYKTFGDGVVTDKPPLGEGFHLVAPWNKVYVYEVRRQEIFEKMKVLSSNGLDIQLDASAWYQPNYNQLGKLHQEIGENYLQRIILPTIRSAARSVVGRYTPEQLYSSKRDAIQAEIFEETKKIVDNQYIVLDDILVRDVTLPPTIKEAIERKLKQEQEALAYQFRLEKEKSEAERKRIAAEGEATANKIINSSLTPELLRMRGIEATKEIANSPNAKVIVVGGGDDGLPLILNGN